MYIIITFQTKILKQKIKCLKNNTLKQTVFMMDGRLFVDE